LVLGILSHSTIRVIAEKTSQISEFKIKGILKKLEIITTDKDYWKILETYKDITSASKEAKLEGILTYLNEQEDEKLLGLITELIRANLLYLSSLDIQEINRFMAKDSLIYEYSKGEIYSSVGQIKEERKITSELENMLNALDPNLSSMYRGAWKALSSGNEEAYRHCISSARELLRQLLDKLAPGSMTRKQRVKEITGSSTQAELVDAIADVVDKLYAVQSAKEHTSPDFESTLYMLKITEHTIYYLLKIYASR
jgi:hypothetical protein